MGMLLYKILTPGHFLLPDEDDRSKSWGEVELRWVQRSTLDAKTHFAYLMLKQDSFQIIQSSFWFTSELVLCFFRNILDTIGRRKRNSKFFSEYLRFPLWNMLKLIQRESRYAREINLFHENSLQHTSVLLVRQQIVISIRVTSCLNTKQLSCGTLFFSDPAPL